MGRRHAAQTSLHGHGRTRVVEACRAQPWSAGTLAMLLQGLQEEAYQEGSLDGRESWVHEQRATASEDQL